MFHCVNFLKGSIHFFDKMFPILFTYVASVDFENICDLKCFIQSMVFPLDDVSIGGGIGARDMKLYSVSINDFSFEEDPTSDLNFLKWQLNATQHCLELIMIY